jgi:hypothetical protein
VAVPLYNWRPVHPTRSDQRDEASSPEPATRLRHGAEVEVLTRFRGDWAAGFVVESLREHGCRLRRMSDGVVLPVEFSYADVRAR